MSINDNIQTKAVLGIRGRLLIGFGITTLIFLIAISITLVIITATKNFATQVIENELPTRNAFLDLGAQIYLTQSSLNGMLLSNSKSYEEEFKNGWNNIDRLEQTLENLSRTWTNQEVFAKWQVAKSLIASLKSVQTNVTNHILDKTIADNLLITDVSPLLNKLLDILDGPITQTGERVGGIFDIQYIDLQKDTQKIINDVTNVQVTEYILSVIGIIASIIIALLTARGILRHINIFRQYSNRVASGDLTQRLSIESRDEIGQLGKDLNTMTDGLSAITNQITLACHNMVTSLEEVKQVINTQSTGATEQASSINEITASLEEIEQSSAQTMEKAKDLGQVAERTREKGQQGLEAVEQSIQGMKIVRDKVQTIAQTILDLSHQTQQVGEITSVVNSLAQQSKMLALNASIEAAKAGDAGKGFAIVASEVRNLAEQSEQSTVQVQKILEDIRHAAEKAVMVTEEGTKGVDQGTGLVEQTGDIVRDLSEVIHEATIASQQIEAAVRQEGIGIEQITTGMNEINQVTASFVASVKQTTEAINNLSQVAKSLKDQVDTYKI